MRAWKLDNEIKALKEAQQNAYDRCISITTVPKEINISCPNNRNKDNLLVTYAKLKSDIEEAVKNLYIIKAEILTAINSVENSIYRTLLIERYINFKTWEQIAVDMNYSYVHIVHTLHPRALEYIKC